MQATCSAIKGVAGHGSRAKGRRGGPAEGWKKKTLYLNEVRGPKILEIRVAVTRITSGGLWSVGVGMLPASYLPGMFRDCLISLSTP